MDFGTALQNLIDHTGDKDSSIDAIFEEVEPLCRTATDGGTDAETTLWDWLYNGEYDPTNTPESLASEWDNLGQYNE